MHDLYFVIEVGRGPCKTIPIDCSVVGVYETKKQAIRRANDMNRKQGAEPIFNYIVTSQGRNL